MPCTAVPLWATERDTFDLDQPLEQGLTTSLLRSLFNQVLDRLESHLEISGDLKPDDTRGDRHGRLRLNFHSEGKVKSDPYLPAEGWLQLSPETEQRDWYFKSKFLEDHSPKSSLLFDTPL